MSFVFRAVDEVGATLNAALVVMGDRLGLYRALAGAGPLTPAEVADRTSTAERYVREWLNAQAAGGFVEYDPDERPLHAAPRTSRGADRRHEPCLPAWLLPARRRLRARFAPYHRRREDGRGHRVARPCSRRASTAVSGSSARVTTPPGRGVVAGARRCHREAGARGIGRRRRLRPWRVDHPDGGGVPDVHVRRFRLPRGLDRHRHAAAPQAAGVGDRVRFEVGRRRRTLVAATTSSPCSTACTTWVTRSARRAMCAQSLAADGTWMIVEPAAGDRIEDNLNPVGPRLLRVLDPALHAILAVAGGRAWRSAPRQAKRASATSSPPPASPASGGSRRRRSTSSTRHGRSSHRFRREQVTPGRAAGRDRQEAIA